MIKGQTDPLNCPTKNGTKTCREVRQIGLHELDKIGLEYVNGKLRVKNEETYLNVKVTDNYR